MCLWLRGYPYVHVKIEQKRKIRKLDVQMENMTIYEAKASLAENVSLNSIMTDA